MDNLADLPLFQKNTVESKPTPLTVSELTQKIKGVVEPAFQEVWVQGEISNYRPAASGHIYFSLKDSGAMISAASFGWGRKKNQSFELKDGLQVLCHGRISIYQPRGSYQIVVDQIEPLGAGALQLAFEQLKNRLAAEGLFDPARKRRLPRFPARVAIVTSPSGAAIRDILNILGRRAPHLRVTVIPAVVQGDTAPAQIIQGIQIANQMKLGEMIILARGGGSMEDLWCFNDEALARAIVSSELPVISAVGHEIDFTISDFASDLRCATPSAAAEVITNHWVQVGEQFEQSKVRLLALIRRFLQTRWEVLRHIAARLVNPKDRVREQAQRCDELSLRMERAVRNLFERRRALWVAACGKLDTLSPLKVLDRGYSILLSPAPEGGPAARGVIRSVKEVRSGQNLLVQLKDGEIPVQVLSDPKTS